MRVLLDHNLPHRLRHHIKGEVETVWHRGWEKLRNGELLEVAEQAGFDVLLTGDQGIRHQQNLSGRHIAVLQLRPRTNRLEDVLPLVDQINQSLNDIRPGGILMVYPKNQ